MPTADCPTIVVYDMTSRQAIVAHAGLGSLVDIAYLLYDKAPRRHFSVVDAIVEKSKIIGFYTMQVFVTCGIRAYQRYDLAPVIRQHYPHTRAVIGTYVDMRLLISEQFATHDIYHVVSDFIDTFNDYKVTRFGTRYLWNSYRRGKTPAEKAKRNLVLVANNSIL